MRILPLLTSAGVPAGLSKLITDVGFPIFVFLVCAYYIYWKDKQQNERIDKMQEDFNSKSEKMQEFCVDLQNKYTELIVRTSETIDNNTDALEKLADKLERSDKNVCD